MIEQYIAFRLDANAEIGTGHFMRCLTLADELNRNGAYICFVCRYLPQHLEELLIKKKYEYKHLISTSFISPFNDELEHSSWLGVSQEQDAIDSIQVLSERTWDWVIIDHYALDKYWELELRKISKNIFVIDDVADRNHDCDILLDQNYYEDMKQRYSGRVPENCKLLLGPTYALLREKFRHLHHQVKPRNGNISRILVFLGGVDRNNITSSVIGTLSKMAKKRLHVDVVIGLEHPFREDINMMCKKYSFICHVQTEKMAELMASSDFSIGAAGSATWERCCLGLPTLMLSLAKNQIDIGKGVDMLGAGQYVEFDNYDDSYLTQAISDLLENTEKVKSYSKQAYGAVDGNGACRVSEAIAY